MIRGPPVNRCVSVQLIYPKGEAMRKTIITLALTAAGIGLGVGVAAADDQTIVVNESNTSTSESSDCLPAEVLAQLPPWLLLGSVPACP